MIGQYPKNYSKSGLLYYIIYIICIKTEADSHICHYISSVARMYQSYWCSSLFLHMHVHTTDISFSLCQIETIGMCVRWLMVSYINIFLMNLQIIDAVTFFSCHLHYFSSLHETYTLKCESKISLMWRFIHNCRQQVIIIDCKSFDLM